MKPSKTIDTKVFVCPLCLPKCRRFRNIGDLNKHLALKHLVSYRLLVVGNRTIAKSRTKEGGLGKEPLIANSLA